MELPGFDKKDIKIDIDQKNCIIISGEKNIKLEENEKFHLRER